VVQPRQDRGSDDSVAIRDLVAVQSGQPLERHVGDARTEASVRSTLVVQGDNATPIVLSLGKDAPASRPATPLSAGRIVEIPQVNGLHHRYDRAAA
jgi:hypothetical protein